MVDTPLIITIIIVAVIALALLGFIIGTYASQTLLYDNSYVRPPLANAVQPNGKSTKMTPEEIALRNKLINPTG
jgi:hypothetical protein